MEGFLYYLVYFVLRALALLPLRVLYVISGLIYLLAFHILGYRKQVVYGNLRNSFPEKSAGEIDLIARRFYRHLCDLTVEIIYLAGISRKEIGRRVRYNNPQVIEKYFSEGRHVAAIMGHYGNWEWLCGFPVLTGYRCISVYRQLKSNIFERLMLRLRTRFGANLVPMKMAIRKIYEFDKKGIPTLNAFMADQAPPREKAYWVGFLNQDTPVYPGVEILARKMDMAVVYFKMNKVRRGYYEFDFIPLFDNARETTGHQITHAHVRMLEKQIKEKPEYWLWSHRRWKVKRHPRDVQYVAPNVPAGTKR